MNARLEEQFFDSTIPIDEDKHFRDCLHVIVQSPLMNNKEIPGGDYSKGIALKQQRKATSIAKTDPRNEYARIIEDSINCADPEYFNQSFQYLLDVDCRMDLVHFERKPSNPQYADQMMALYANDTTAIIDRTIDGRCNIIDHFLGSMTTTPDGIFLAHETKMFLRPNNACCLVMKFSYTGIKMFQSTLPCLFQPEDDDEMQYDEVLKPTVSFDEEVTSLDEEDEDHILHGHKKNTRKHSIHFLETTKASKYDHRKRHKKFTVGEFVGKHQTDDKPKLNDLYPNDATTVLHVNACPECMLPIPLAVSWESSYSCDDSSTKYTGSSLSSSNNSTGACVSLHDQDDEDEVIADWESVMIDQLLDEPNTDTALDEWLEELSQQSTTSSSVNPSTLTTIASPVMSTDDDMYSASSSSLHSVIYNTDNITLPTTSPVAIPSSAQKRMRSIQLEGTPVNIHGILRWTINNANQITHIQCTKLTQS